MQHTGSSDFLYSPQAQYGKICSPSQTPGSENDQVPGAGGYPGNVAQFEASIRTNRSLPSRHCRDMSSSEARHDQLSASSMDTACSTLISTTYGLNSTAFSCKLDLTAPSVLDSDLSVNSYARNQAYPCMVGATDNEDTTLDFAFVDLDCALSFDENSITPDSKEASAMPHLVTIDRHTMLPSETEDGATRNSLPRTASLTEDTMAVLQSATNDNTLKSPESQTSIEKKPNTRILRTTSCKSKNRGRTNKHSTFSTLSRQEEDRALASQKTHARNSHNKVEKQYRNRLNQRFLNLLKVLPRIAEANFQTDLAIGGNKACKFGRVKHDDSMQFSKGEVLEMASRYIQTLKQEREELHEEINQLLGRESRETHGIIRGESHID